MSFFGYNFYNLCHLMGATDRNLPIKHGKSSTLSRQTDSLLFKPYVSLWVNRQK